MVGHSPAKEAENHICCHMVWEMSAWPSFTFFVGNIHHFFAKVTTKVAWLDAPMRGKTNSLSCNRNSPKYLLFISIRYAFRAKLFPAITKKNKKKNITNVAYAKNAMKARPKNAKLDCY